MTDFNTDKIHSLQKTKRKINSMNWQAQPSSSLAISLIPQSIRLKVLPKNMPHRPATPFPMSLKR